MNELNTREDLFCSDSRCLPMDVFSFYNRTELFLTWHDYNVFFGEYYWNMIDMFLGGKI